MPGLRQAAGAGLLLLGGILAASNARLFWRAHVRKEQGAPSMIPIVGGLLGAAGAAIVPALKAWAWLPPLLDPGCGFYVALAIWVSARGR